MNLPISVSELTRKIRELLESEFKFVYIVGEISNFKLHIASGHFYFTLKDDRAQISANMWNSRNRELIFTPENGMKVIIKGRVTLYESKGTYQIDVFEMMPYGIGELQIAFEKLRQKLFEEGLFGEENKKPIPEFPERVGIITSESSAALQDFLKVTRKRYPIVELYLIHANVQNTGSVENICRAIRIANKSKVNLDVLVITRGGGSMEDLWSFNEEKVAREIFNSQIPIVTAIGHEVDFTICDFVADLRAPTPSAAAEMIFPDKSELIKRINECEYDIKDCVISKLNSLKYLLDNISNNYYFKRPLDLINENKIKLDDINNSLESSVEKKLFNLGRCLDSSEKLLKNISPEQTLKRGFTMIIKEERLISRKNKIKKDDNIEIRFYDGERKAIVND